MAMRGIARIVFRRNRGLLFQQEENNFPQSKHVEGRISSFLPCPYKSWNLASSVALGGQRFMSTNIRRKRNTQGDKKIMPQEQDLNPRLTFYLAGKRVMEEGYADFPDALAAEVSPLAKALFDIGGVTRVFYGSDFVTVTKSEENSWDYLKDDISKAIMDFYSYGKPLFLYSQNNVKQSRSISLKTFVQKMK